MKISYKISISLLFTALIIWIFLPSITISVGEKIQGASVIIALLSAVIALSIADMKKKIIKVKIEEPYIKNLDQEIFINNQRFKSISDISESEIKERYKKFNQPIKFYIVEFEIINKSNFTWKNPSFTYETPVDQRYLVSQGENVYEEHLPHTNYHYRLSEKYYLVSGDRDIFSSIKLPYINNEKGLKIWFTLFLDCTMEKFTINMSINCENAEGTTEKIEIDPKKLLENFNNKNLKN